MIDGGSGGIYSAATTGAGLITGSQDPAGNEDIGPARISLTGSIQPNATVMATSARVSTSAATLAPIPAATATPGLTPTGAITPAPSSTPDPGSCFPAYTGTPQGNDAGFFSAISVPAASTAPRCYQVAFVQTDNPGNGYTGYPRGWTPVLSKGGPEESEIIIHQNGQNEPASNLWTTAGTINEVYELNVSAICNTSGYDGGIIGYSGRNATSMNIGAPQINSTGVNNLTLVFSNMPWNSMVTVTGADGITGYYTSVPSLGGYWYQGVPQSFAVSVSPTSSAFDGDGVTFQAAFASGKCTSTNTH